jgi:hypothetical protein
MAETMTDSSRRSAPGRLVSRLLLVAACCTLWTATTRVASAADFTPAKNPDWCHERYRCLTIEDYATMTTIKLQLDADNEKLRFQMRHNLSRFWKTVGVEYELNDHKYHPYATFGVGVGKADVWVGFAGDNPQAGVGWRF